MAQAFKKLIPLFDRILVQKAEAISKTKGGIVLPDKGQKIVKGTVVAVGPGARNQQGDFITPSVQIGDTVLLPEYGGTKVDIEENKEFHLYKESEILAKIES